MDGPALLHTSERTIIAPWLDGHLWRWHADCFPLSEPPQLFCFSVEGGVVRHFETFCKVFPRAALVPHSLWTTPLDGCKTS